MNKHDASDLAQMQSLSLESKVLMTKQRIRDWYNHFDGDVYVSWSGGKDSTVLKHIVDSMYDDVPAVYVNTGLEYPEITRFVKFAKIGEFDCFNSDVEILQPEMRFDEVIKKYGYPVISKEVSGCVYWAKRGSKSRIQRLNGTVKNKDGTLSMFNCAKWKYLLEAPFEVGNKCCDIIKKKPIMKYERKTGKKPILALMASESIKRKTAWMKTGCNAYEKGRPQSQPMAFWTEQDVLQYIKKNNVPYAPVYGDIVEDDSEMIDGQVTLAEMFDNYDGVKLKTTGCDRTGCMFCMFGVHLDKEPNRFQRMKITHPKQYEYCMKDVEQGGLGIKKVLEFINVKYE